MALSSYHVMRSSVRVLRSPETTRAPRGAPETARAPQGAPETALRALAHAQLDTRLQLRVVGQVLVAPAQPAVGAVIAIRGRHAELTGQAAAPRQLLDGLEPRILGYAAM